MANDSVGKIRPWLHRAEFQLGDQADGPVLAETSLSIVSSNSADCLHCAAQVSEAKELLCL